MKQQPDGDLAGWVNALLAFGWWGFIFPSLLLLMNWVAAEQIQSPVAWSLEILSIRIGWCVAFCLLLLWWNGRLKELKQVYDSRSMLLWFVLSSLLILLNWIGFIVGAATQNLNQTSLGYYMGPIFNVLLGYFFLGERLKKLQIVAVVLTLIGIVWLTIQVGRFPWIALCLALSFGCYSLVRKKIQVSAITGLTVESIYCLPVAMLLPFFLIAYQESLVILNSRPLLHFLLFLTGPATAIPLIAFAVAAKRLRLSTLGFIQFIAPTGQLILACWANREELTLEKWIGYFFVWGAVAIYLFDLRRSMNQEKKN